MSAPKISSDKHNLIKLYNKIKSEIQGTDVNREIFDSNLILSSNSLIIHYIEESIDILVNKTIQNALNTQKETLPHDIQDTENYEMIIIQLEAEIRHHIQIENQLKLQIESLESRICALVMSENEVDSKQCLTHPKNSKMVTQEEMESMMNDLRSFFVKEIFYYKSIIEALGKKCKVPSTNSRILIKDDNNEDRIDNDHIPNANLKYMHIKGIKLCKNENPICNYNKIPHHDGPKIKLNKRIKNNSMRLDLIERKQNETTEKFPFLSTNIPKNKSNVSEIMRFNSPPKMRIFQASYGTAINSGLKHNVQKIQSSNLTKLSLINLYSHSNQ